MKIIFLCGALEPECDGVGDYVRSLAEELIRQGHHIAIAAINDGHIELMQNSGLMGPEELSVLRLPSNLPEEDRIALARVFIDSFNPDWISLQFVAEAFHSRGLNFGFAKKMLTAGNGRKFEIMFHDLWMGADADAGTVDILLGKLQRILIKSLIRKMQPQVIHTHSDRNKQQLESIGTEPALLPLVAELSGTSRLTALAEEFVADLHD